MLSLHPQAHTTPAVRQEIARSTEPTGVLAQRFGQAPRSSASGASAGRRTARATRAECASCPIHTPSKVVAHTNAKEVSHRDNLDADRGCLGQNRAGIAVLDTGGKATFLMY